MNSYPLFISCPRGLEAVLAQELSALGAEKTAALDGGVRCRGSLQTVYRINLHARTAGRVLLQLAAGGYRSEHDVYRLARETDWPAWFAVGQTFKVQIEGKRPRVKSLEFTALKVKDALCDRFHDATGSRPSVDKAAPDVRVHVFLDEQQALLFVDTSGEALFKRGYRRETGAAPLRENLAAGLLLLAGYDGSQPFQVPFCGSGTIAIEAAWIAQNRAPGLLRRFAFEQLRGFDAALWQRLRTEAQDAVRPAPAPLAASDIDQQAVRHALANIEAAQLADVIAVRRGDALAQRPNGDGGLMLSNPPYGVRLAEIQALHALYPQLGSWLKQHYAGWQIGMFSGDRDMPKLMRLSPKRKIPLYNGKLDCRLFLLDMVQGSNRRA